MTTEDRNLIQEARDRACWYAFWVSNRQYHCEANRRFLDEWLTQNMKNVTPEHLEEAFQATKNQLAKVSNPTPIRLREEPAAPVAEPITDNSPDAAIPKEITRSVIVHDMDKLQFRKLLRDFGAVAVEYRMNKPQQIEVK